MSFVQGDDETVSGEIVASFSDKFAALMSLSTLADFAGKALLDTTREKKGMEVKFQLPCIGRYMPKTV